jgi:TPP-dependent pyruvate/acetoin dehydrogenase alpha subunit
MNKQELIDFENEVAEKFNSGIIHAPIHLSGNNEDELIDIFKNITRMDYVFSTHRSHYHALLHGVPRDKVMAEILAGHSMNLNFPEHRFYTSAIVGGILPIALGMAAGIKMNGLQSRVYAFIGDMAATTGIFHECYQYAVGQKLPITFIIENNEMSTDSPTVECWGHDAPMLIFGKGIIRYGYKRIHPHVGTGKFVTFV